jgi:hypothetical protein
VRPGAASLQFRWRIGSWLVGVLPFGWLTVFLAGAGAGWMFLVLCGALVGAAIANPWTVPARLASHDTGEPVIRLRPLGVIGFAVVLCCFALPFAIGDWSLSLVARRFGGGDGQTSQEAPTAGGDTEPFDLLFYEPPRRGRWRRLFGG